MIEVPEVNVPRVSVKRVASSEPPKTQPANKPATGQASPKGQPVADRIQLNAEPPPAQASIYSDRNTHSLTAQGPSQTKKPPLSEAEYTQAAKAAGLNPDPKTAVREHYRTVRTNSPGVYDPRYRDTSNPDNIFSPANEKVLDQPIDIADPEVYRKYSRDGWIRTRNSADGEEQQVVSMNVEPSKKLISKLDTFLQAHKDSVNQYKFPDDVTAWAARRDPITMYVTDAQKFEASGARQVLEGILRGHNRMYDAAKAEKWQERNPGKELPHPDGKLLGRTMVPGARIADFPSPSSIEALIERAHSINPRVAKNLAEELGPYQQLSVGQYHSWQTFMDQVQNNSRLRSDNGDESAAVGIAAGTQAVKNAGLPV